MKKELLNELAQSAYDARKKAMITGAYPERAVHVPDSGHFYEWDEMPEDLSKPVQELYRKEVEAALGTFFCCVLVDGTSEAKRALHTLLTEAQDMMLTDEEIASGEGGERQQ